MSSAALNMAPRPRLTEMTDTNQTILEVKGLAKYFSPGHGVLSRHRSCLKAVDGVDFQIKRGEILGLVGESGCGKTTVAKCILRLLEPTAGTICLEGKNILGLGKRGLKQLRKEMQMIFQDPYDSLDPRMRIGSIIAEPLLIHRVVGRGETKEKVAELLDLVGLTSTHIDRFPHELSGGQRQRIVLARALSLNPKVIIADEPVSALDVSVQAQIINLLLDLQEKFNLTCLFISHDLSVVANVCDRIAVMHLGKIVEMLDSEDLFSRPIHPYTKAMLSAVPVPDPEAKGQTTDLSEK